MKTLKNLFAINPDTEKAAEELKDNFVQLLKNENIHGFNLLALFFKKGGIYSLESMQERFWGIIFEQEIIPQMNKIYSKLVKEKHTEENQREFNDMDDHVFMIKNKTKKIVCHTMQNENIIYIWNKNTSSPFDSFSIRRFYDDFDIENNSYHSEQDGEFIENVKKNGVLGLLRNNYFDKYSDDVLNNPYPRKPSLNTFRKTGFKLTYDDCRDIGYIGTFSGLNKTVDKASSNHRRLETIYSCDIKCLMNELFEE